MDSKEAFSFDLNATLPWHRPSAFWSVTSRLQTTLSSHHHYASFGPFAAAGSNDLCDRLDPSVEVPTCSKFDSDDRADLRVGVDSIRAGQLQHLRKYQRTPLSVFNWTWISLRRAAPRRKLLCTTVAKSVRAVCTLSIALTRECVCCKQLTWALGKRAFGNLVVTSF